MYICTYCPFFLSSKELWPIMDKWIKNRVGNANSSSPSDIIVATVLRLIGEYVMLRLKSLIGSMNSCLLRNSVIATN